MAIEYNALRDKALKYTAELMCVAARTAPKTRGWDNLIIVMLNGNEKERVIERMKVIAERDSLPSCARDAGNIEPTDFIIVIGTKKKTVGLNCGFCGFKTCDELSEKGGVCAYNSMDLGIALGSSAALAARLHADNRLMFSIGKAALECGLLGGEAVQAIGIPLSATGKNPYFDRK